VAEQKSLRSPAQANTLENTYEMIVIPDDVHIYTSEN